jgi:site-specific DNA-methyltransferase (adenine-specific)
VRAASTDLFPELTGATRPGAESDEWYTPAAVFDPLHREFRFTLDAAATRESAKVRRFFTRAQDGLAQSWRGERVWVNPPYSDIGPWVAKAQREIVDGGAELVAMLLPAWTDRAWWHLYIEPHRDRGRPVAGLPWLETRFLRGRVRFGYPGNVAAKGRQTGGFDPSVIVVWRGRPTS